MDYTTKSDISIKTTSYSSDDVTDVWTIGFASLFGAGIVMAAVLCLAGHAVSRCKASRQKQKSKNLYEKISGDLEFIEGGYCKLKGTYKHIFKIIAINRIFFFYNFILL